MKYIKIIYILSFFTFLFANPGSSNNVTFTNQDFGAQNTNAHTRIVQFDISWQNSWRDDENYDCPWVFLKYSTDGGITWHHCTLKTSGTNPDGFVQGSGIGLDIIVPSDKKGAFLRRSLAGEGTVNTTGIQIPWDYGADLGANTAGDHLAAFAAVRLMATEMCYIPQGPFYMGDFINSYTYVPTCVPRNSDASGTARQIIVQTNDVYAMKIKIMIDRNRGDGTIPIDDAEGPVPPDEGRTSGAYLISHYADQYPGTCSSGIWFDGSSGISIDSATNINMNTNWPTGFRAFYYARYEVSQAQYRDFLNTLTPTQVGTQGQYQSACYPGYNPGIRYGIRDDHGLFGCDLNNNGIFDETDDGECVPVSYSEAENNMSYNDWAALRLVTDCEYEKAGRGPNTPIAQEAANGYGGASVYASSYANPGTADEAPSNNDDSGAWIVYNRSTAVGPLRCGALATATSSRKKSGAGYYGNMDLTGNVWEDCISMGTIKGRSYTAVHGDGELGPNGYHNVTNWPGGPDVGGEGDGHRIPLADRAISGRGGEWDTMAGTYTGKQAVWLMSRHTWNQGYFHLYSAYNASHGLRGGRSAE